MSHINHWRGERSWRLGWELWGEMPGGVFPKEMEEKWTIHRQRLVHTVYYSTVVSSGSSLGPLAVGLCSVWIQQALWCLGRKSIHTFLCTDEPNSRRAVLCCVVLWWRLLKWTATGCIWMLGRHCNNVHLPAGPMQPMFHLLLLFFFFFQLFIDSLQMAKNNCVKRKQSLCGLGKIVPHFHTYQKTRDMPINWVK